MHNLSVSSLTMEASEQSSLETQLQQVGDAAQAKIKKMAGLQDGLLKDTETALERDFKSMRSVMRSLETLAEDQECVKSIDASVFSSCSVDRSMLTGRKRTKTFCRDCSSTSGSTRSFKLHTAIPNWQQR